VINDEKLQIEKVNTRYEKNIMKIIFKNNLPRKKNIFVYVDNKILMAPFYTSYNF
jgi:hypothetical protein